MRRAGRRGPIVPIMGASAEAPCRNGRRQRRSPSPSSGPRIVETPGGLGGPAFVTTLSGGLDDGARLHVVGRMWPLAESGLDPSAAARAVEVLKAHVGRRDAARLERIANDPGRPSEVREAARRAADVASSRD